MCARRGLACALAYLARYELWRAKASDQLAFWSLGNSKHDRAWRWYADEGLGCREYGREKRKHAANVSDSRQNAMMTIKYSYA